jgi:hypothetical protein
MFVAIFLGGLIQALLSFLNLTSKYNNITTQKIIHKFNMPPSTTLWCCNNNIMICCRLVFLIK